MKVATQKVDSGQGNVKSRFFLALRRKAMLHGRCQNFELNAKL